MRYKRRAAVRHDVKRLLLLLAQTKFRLAHPLDCNAADMTCAKPCSQQRGCETKQEGRAHATGSNLGYPRRILLLGARSGCDTICFLLHACDSLRCLVMGETVPMCEQCDQTISLGWSKGAISQPPVDK